jgi:hypothetical protein
MTETATHSIRTRYSGKSRPRTLTWISDAYFHGPGCSQCAWLFRPSGPPTGNSLHEMKKNYVRRCNEEFARHVCAQHSRPANARSYCTTLRKTIMKQAIWKNAR